MTQTEIKIDQMRMKALTTDTSLLKSTMHKIYFSQSRKTAFVALEEDPDVKYIRVDILKYAGFDLASLKTMKSMAIKDRTQVNVDSSAKNNLVLIASDTLLSMDKAT